MTDLIPVRREDVALMLRMLNQMVKATGDGNGVEAAKRLSAALTASQEQQAEIERLKAELGHVQMKYEHALGKVSGGRLMNERPKMLYEGRWLELDIYEIAVERDRYKVALERIAAKFEDTDQYNVSQHLQLVLIVARKALYPEYGGE